MNSFSMNSIERKIYYAAYQLIKRRNHELDQSHTFSNLVNFSKKFNFAAASRSFGGTPPGRSANRD